MSKYLVPFFTTVSTTVTVEAESKEEAREKASMEVYVGLCHQCAGEMNPPEDWEASENDDDIIELDD